jgi:hypothetical protein
MLLGTYKFSKDSRGASSIETSQEVAKKYAHK